MKRVLSAPLRLLQTSWHFAKLLSDRSFERRFRLLWDYAKISFYLRVTPRRRKPLKVLGFQVHYPSLATLRDLFNEIILEGAYHYRAATPQPRIIDAGANIGLTTLYYLFQNPGARIDCFEPDPRTFAILQDNIQKNQLDHQVTLHNVALADSRGKVTLYFEESFEGDTGQSISRDVKEDFAKSPLSSQKVPAEPLSDYLNETVDMLKVDIEGSEGIVLREAARKLKNVQQLQMEFHYDPKLNQLHPLLELFEKSGFSYRIVIPHGPGLENRVNSLCLIYATRR